MGLIHVTVTLRPMHKSRKKYEADFLVDTVATDSMAPANHLRKAGIVPVGKMGYELADGKVTDINLASPSSSLWETLRRVASFLARTTSNLCLVSQPSNRLESLSIRRVKS